MQRGFVSIFVQLFNVIVSKAYYSQFTQPFVEELDKVVDNVDANILKGL